MSRLTKRNADGSVGIAECRYYNYEDFQKLAKKLADYEDKQEQGLLIELPCKVGDTLYQIGKGWYQIGTDITEFTVTAITISKDRIIISVENENQMGFSVSIDCIGKRLFLTYSEAEETLAKMGGKWA